jgi:uncharacterized protein (DUF427 family)
MATKLQDLLSSALPDLRYQPVTKHVRARLGDTTVADTQHAVLLWEPRRVVPQYAVPVADLTAELTAAPVPEGGPGEGAPVQFEAGGPPVLDPRSPFAVHSASGEPLTVVAGDARLEGAAFRLDDAALPDYVVLDFDAFDWLEEDEPLVGHPRDPFHRIDVRASSRKVRIERGGTLLAESSRPQLLFEAAFPMPRYYLPKDDVAVPLLPSDTHTACAYKGHATHWSVELGGRVVPDLAWSYEDPLSDAEQVRGLVSFYQERLDVTVDGEKLERPVSPWSKDPGV